MPAPQITLTSPLGEDLKFESMKLSEGLSMLGEMQLTLRSLKPDLQPEDLLGKPVTVTVELRSGQRHFNGYVTRFGAGRHQGRYFGYTATVHPWLWFLARTSDCRIFTPENIADGGGEAPNTVPNIVKKVFKDHGVADFEFKLFRAGEYREWPYCVQYRETDLNFVTRLLEQEGIYWYFRHSEGKHKLVLVDMFSVHVPVPDYEMLPYFANAQGAPPDTEYVSEWDFSREVCTGKLALASYDFERPSAADLQIELAEPRSHALADYEQFDFQGDYASAAHGKLYAENRIHELQAGFERIKGRSNAHGLAAGHLFSLSNPPHTTHGSQFLCTRTLIEAKVDGYEAGNAPGRFDCSFEAIPARQQFRPERSTRKPSVKGPQTAVVTGPAGAEIHTDKYGRVKVQFHWDRYGRKDEKSSCWIRVSHPWAGKGWGSVSIPRIGQEVIVDFLEGDPDQPIITGRVYNAASMPPFSLPDDAVVSGLKSKTHKGQGFNEISMNDTAGQEKMNLHAQYDMATTVLHDQTLEVKNNRTSHVVVDDTLNVDANRTMHVKGKLAETVDTGQEVTVSAGYTETINGGSTSTVMGGATSTITGGLTSTVNGAWGNTVNGHLSETVTSGEDQTVSGGKAVTVTGDYSEGVTGARSITITGPMTQSATATLDLHATGAATYTSAASLTLAVSGSMVEITPSAITISAGGATVKV
ncbi:MAG TPA: type VI secretion system tip protein TssI/VgrG, partial [Burkholderiaceae bacterium]|nr:type VI secretion system tip protein TssI/VgrG [Burkholderiaceae bacterium]